MVDRSPSRAKIFFPAVDAGTFRIALRAPTGTRIEQTPSWLRSGAAIRHQVPANELEGILITSGFRFGHQLTTTTVEYQDGRCRHLVSLKPNTSRQRIMSAICSQSEPRISRYNRFYFPAGDIVSKRLTSDFQRAGYSSCPGEISRSISRSRIP